MTESGYYVIIKRLKSYKYGEAMLSPVSTEGSCYAAIAHGTVLELQALASEAGHKLLGIFREPFDGQELWSQEKHFAELLQAKEPSA